MDDSRTSVGGFICKVGTEVAGLLWFRSILRLGICGSRVPEPTSQFVSFPTVLKVDWIRQLVPGGEVCWENEQREDVMSTR